MVKVTVYIPTHNNSRYLNQAINSVLNQKFSDWELIVIDDGSTDNTRDILRAYENNHKIKIIYQENKGLTITNNIALRISNGEYIIRLDGDDYLDENTLLVLSNILDKHPEIGLVYPDWYNITEDGEIVDIERRNKVDETVLFDIPAHGACTMIRKSCLIELGGYNEQIHCQDGYDLWIRFIGKYKVYNVNCPLFYYRKHSKNMTGDKQKIIDTRRSIKRDFVEKRFKDKVLKVAGIIPVRGYSDYYADLALKDINGKKMIDYTIEASLQSNLLDKVILTTNDDNILEHCKKYEKIIQIKRPNELCKVNSDIKDTLVYVLDKLEKDNYIPDAVMTLYINCPLRRTKHIEKAIDTMMIFDLDKVISVCEDPSKHYQHHSQGLKPLFHSRKLRLEREYLYEENSAVYLTKTKFIKANNFTGTLGHIIMLKEESLNIHDEFDFWVAEKILKEKRLNDIEACHG